MISSNYSYSKIMFAYNYISAQSAGAVEYTNCSSAERKPSQWWWGSSDAGTLGNAEHSFIATAPRSTPEW